MAPQPEANRGTSLLAHTDLGSVTLVWNVLGGLQILPPGSTDYETGWQFVKPLSGCAMVNMGDAMVKFSDGIVRSNLHRVAYALGEQAMCDRYSLIYFSRPEDDVVIEPLVTAGETREKGEKRFTSKSGWP